MTGPNIASESGRAGKGIWAQKNGKFGTLSRGKFSLETRQFALVFKQAYGRRRRADRRNERNPETHACGEPENLCGIPRIKI